MKKRLVSSLLILILVFSVIGPSASAEVVTNLGSINAGESYSQIIYRANSLFTAYMYDANGDGNPDSSLPAGLSLSLESAAGEDGSAQCALRLSGIPTVAGSYSFSITVDFGDGTYDLIHGSLSIFAATPGLSICADQTCDIDSVATVSVEVFSTDNGTLSYQWYSNTGRSTEGGVMIPGANSCTFSFTVAAPEESYFYCAVTNNNNGSTATAFSPVTRVISRKVTGIAISAFPAKMVYKEKDEVDLTGMKITAVYSDGTSAMITDAAQFTAEPKTVTTVGFEVIKVSYGGFSIDLPVQVERGKEEVQILRMPSKVSYKIGESLDTTGLTLRVFDSSGYTDVTSGFSCSPNVLTRSGQQTITVIYSNGESATFTVYVDAAKVEEKLEIVSTPDKLEYTVGDTLDTTGLMLKFWSGSDGRDVTSGFTCTPSVFTYASNSQAVTVRYNNKTATFTVTVKEAEPVETIPVVTPPTITVKPNGGGTTHTDPPKPQKSGGAPVAVVIMAVIIAGAALAGAVTYFVMIRRSGAEDFEEELPEVEADDPFVPEPPAEASVPEEIPDAEPAPIPEPEAPAPELSEDQPPVNELDPDKKDYFEGLFDDQ